MNGSQEVVGFGLKEFVAQRYPGGDQFCDPPFDNCFGLLRIFELITDSHPLPCLDQFGEVGVQGVVRKACQGCFIPSIIALGEHDVEDAGGFFRIIAESLVKITHPEEQHGIRVFGLDAVELLHQRGGFFAFGSHVDLIL